MTMEAKDRDAVGSAETNRDCDSRYDELELVEAAYRFATSEELEVLLALDRYRMRYLYVVGAPETAADIAHGQWLDAFQNPSRELLRRLQSGELEAFGFVQPLDVSKGRQRIHAELWSVLDPYFHMSSATYEHSEIKNIVVRFPLAIPEPPPQVRVDFVDGILTIGKTVLTFPGTKTECRSRRACRGLGGRTPATLG